MAAQVSYLAAQGLHLAAQELYLTPPGFPLAAQGLHSVGWIWHLLGAARPDVVTPVPNACG